MRKLKMRIYFRLISEHNSHNSLLSVHGCDAENTTFACAVMGGGGEIKSSITVEIEGFANHESFAIRRRSAAVRPVVGVDFIGEPDVLFLLRRYDYYSRSTSVVERFFFIHRIRVRRCPRARIIMVSFQSDYELSILRCPKRAE